MLRAKAPAYRTIPDAAFQRRRRAVQLCYSLLAPSCDTPCGLTNLGQCAKIVVPRHLLLISGFFAWFDGAAPDFLQRFACESRRLNSIDSYRESLRLFSPVA